MGIFDRLRRRQVDRPADGDARGLFTARSGAVPSELVGGPRDGDAEPVADLWDHPAPAPTPGPAAAPAPAPEVEALTELDPEPPAPTDHVEHTTVVATTPDPTWDEPAWADDEPERRPELPTDGGSTADEPLFGAHEEAPAPVPPPRIDPVPPLFEHPPVATEPAVTELVDPPAAEAEVAEAEVAGAEAAAPESGRTMRVHDGRLDKRPGPIRMTPSEAIALAQDGPQALRRRTPPGT